MFRWTRRGKQKHNKKIPASISKIIKKLYQVPGEPGLDGVPGRAGADGIPGKDGIPGTDGKHGLNGKDGEI